jgi:hypothetical protein
MEKKIFINDTDCSALFMRYGYTVNYKKIHGNAGGTMLDGSTTEDVIAVKAVISLSFMPQKEADLASFLASLYGSDYAIVSYYDPKDGDYREIEAIYSEVNVKHIMSNINDDEIWQTDSLTLTER